MNPRKFTILTLLGALWLTGCKNKDEPETTPPVETKSTDEGEHPDKDPNKANIQIGPKILELCGISADEANFDFNSAKISEAAKKTLNAVAECFLTGPGVGKNLNIVGHADPRGSEDYNFALGQKRAGNVGSYFNKKGLGDDRVASSSRGELDATGSDDAGWAADRRVDILLAE